MEKFILRSLKSSWLIFTKIFRLTVELILAQNILLDRTVVPPLSCIANVYEISI